MIERRDRGIPIGDENPLVNDVCPVVVSELLGDVIDVL